MPDDERDPLSWEGDADDDTLVTGTEAPDARGAATGATTAVVAGPAVARGTRLVGMLFLALAIASAVGWVVVMLENPVQAQTLLGLAFYQLGELLAVLAPVAWWIAASRLARQSVPWWIAGLLVTAPWPLVVGVLA